MSKLWPNSKALRKNRFSLSGQVYLVTTACRDRDPIFSDVRLGAFVAEEILLSDQESRTYTFAFVVMPDHLHWLFELRPGQSLSSIVQRTKGWSAYRINLARGSSGPVWHTGFHDRAVRAEESLESLGNYVIHNPVRAGLVSEIDEYPLWNLMWNRG